MPLKDGSRLGQEGGLVGIGRAQVNDPAMAGKEFHLPIKCACGSGLEPDERRVRGGRSRRARRLL
jgi:hypothetical protein